MTLTGGRARSVANTPATRPPAELPTTVEAFLSALFRFGRRTGRTEGRVATMTGKHRAAFIVVMTALAILCAALSWWADRNPCAHPEWVDLGNGDAVCTSCDDAFRLEER